MARREVKAISKDKMFKWSVETPAYRLKQTSKPDSEEQSIKSLWQSFTQSTGMHGMSHLGGKDPLAYKIRIFCWVLAITAMAIILIYILVTAIQEFYTFPKVTSYTVEVKDHMDFPAVTICNFSPLNRSELKLASNPELLNFFLANSPLYGLSQTTNWSSNAFYDREMTAKWYENVAMNGSRMLVWCWFNRVSQPCMNLFSPIHTNLGHCFQFNGDKKRPRDVTMTGSMENLVVLVFVDQQNYVYSQEPAAGVQVKIHNQRIHPDDESSEVIAGVGTTTYIQMSKAEYKFLPHPFTAFGNRECFDRGKNISYGSYNECLRRCRVRQIFEKCRCYRVSDTEPGVRCSPRQLTECYLPTYRTVFNEAGETRACGCLSPCRFDIYNKQVSTATLPSDFWSWFFIKRNFVPDKEYMRNNYLELRIFFGDMLVETMEQVPQYSFADVIASIGGQMGLFLGASILTLTELGEFLILVCVHCCRGRRTRETRVDSLK